jgi:hypothetical protein
MCCLCTVLLIPITYCGLYLSVWGLRQKGLNQVAYIRAQPVGDNLGTPLSTLLVAMTGCYGSAEVATDGHAST